MITRLKIFLFERQGRSASGGKHDRDELHLATAALLLEAALLDGSLDQVELDSVTRLVRDRFDLSDEAVALIVTEAEEKARDAADIWGFLRVLIANFDHDEQVELVEMLWDVICADGVIHYYEANLVRRVVGMSSVSDREAATAKKRVMARYQISA